MYINLKKDILQYCKRKCLLLTIISLFYPFLLKSQSIDADYEHLDSLIETESMVNSLSVLKILETTLAKDSLKAKYWIRHSKASYVLYRQDDAKNSIKKAIMAEPKNAEIYFVKGELYNQMNDLQASLAAFDSAVKINPIGKYFFWRGIMNQRLKMNDFAERDYLKAIEKKFESAELYSNLTILLSEKEKFIDALKAIDKALSLNKKNPKTYSMKAKIYLALLNIDSACVSERIALGMGAKNTIGIPDSICDGSKVQKMQFAAEVSVLNKYYNQSIKAFSILVEDYKVKKSDIFLNRGYCYFQMKDYDKAEKDYLEALKSSDVTKDLILDNLSLLYFKKDDFQKSLEYTNKRLELKPDNHVAYLDRGLCNRKLKRFEEAEKDFNKSLEINPNFFRAFGYRAFLYLQLGKIEMSLADAKKSVELNPQYGYGYLVLGQVKQELNISGFCDDFYNANKYGEKDAEIALKQYCK